MAKSKKVEKETRRLLETINDLVKKKGDKYKFKSKNKKLVKKVKKTCPHWILRKGKEVPTVRLDPDRPGYWKCAICEASFPIKPLENEGDYKLAVQNVLELVNQIQFYSVKLGGNAEDTKMFLRLKECLPRFDKVSHQVIKRIKHRQEFEKKKKAAGALEQFNSYSGFQYNM